MIAPKKVGDNFDAATVGRHGYGDTDNSEHRCSVSHDTDIQEIVKRAGHCLEIARLAEWSGDLEWRWTWRRRWALALAEAWELGARP